jgi:biopolymer transport protein ExbD
MPWNRQLAEELPHINMTPMVDVVLCLLIFFMVATRFYDWDESQFTVRVPQVSNAAPLTRSPKTCSSRSSLPARSSSARRRMISASSPPS